ncbi:MAG: helix-turn-helix domain-containing protein [Acidobacteriota bacterium]
MKIDAPHDHDEHLADSMDALFHALANRARRRILDLVNAEPGCTVGEVCASFDMSRIGVLKHINVLEAADLLFTEKEGRARRLYFNVVPIQTVYDRWTTEYSAMWASHLTRLRYRVERQEDES